LASSVPDSSIPKACSEATDDLLELTLLDRLEWIAGRMSWGDTRETTVIRWGAYEYCDLRDGTLFIE